MPFNPAVAPRTDQYIYNQYANTGQILSEDLLKTLTKLDEQKKTNAFGDMVVGKLSQTKGTDGKPYIPVDALLRYEKGSSAQKAGIVQGALANAQLDSERQKAAVAADEAKAHADYFRAAAQGKLDVGDGQPFLPVTDAGGKVIPGQIYVKKTGAIHDVSEAGQAPVISQDGKFYLDRKTNSFKPLPAATMVLPGMGGSGAGAPGGGPAAAQPTFPGVGGNGAGPTAAPAAAGNPAGAAQAAAIKQQFQAGQITREQAVAQLQALGFQ